MLGVLYLAVYIFVGIFIIQNQLPRLHAIVRIWLGSCLGILLMMWLPYLCGFALKFSVSAHWLALLPLAALAFCSMRFKSRLPVTPWGEKDTSLAKVLLFTVLPLCLLSFYLQWTHVLEPEGDGLHVGQSTWGDLNLHLAIISSARNATLPLDYNIFPGKLLCYPFLTDTFSTSFMLMGGSLRFAVVFPSCVLLALTFTGYLFLADALADTKKGAILAFFLFFINGGLGFLYVFDMQGVALGSYGADQLRAGRGLLERLRNILEGWYQTPVNHAEFTTYNLRWSNVLCDMLTPQRTTMGGWCMVLPCLYLLYYACSNALTDHNLEIKPVLLFHREKEQIVYQPREELRVWLLLGLLAGMLPMVHTHSFLALGLISFGALVYFIRQRKKNVFPVLARFGLYAGATILLALPQLIEWTFSQTAGNENFLNFHFNWVNNSGSNGLRDGYLWFYVKNIGLPFLFLLFALFEKNKKHRFIGFSIFFLFLAAEFIQFQPNEYDNNKLFYIWYMPAAIIAADSMSKLYGCLRELRSRKVIAVLTLIACFLSGSLSIARECVSDYRMYNNDETEAAAFIESNTKEHSVFMTSTHYINPVSSLCGRTIVCGPSLWLYWHGYDINSRSNEISAFYQFPAENEEVLQKYDVDYIYVSDAERSNISSIDEEAISERYELIFSSQNGSIQIYRTGKTND